MDTMDSLDICLQPTETIDSGSELVVRTAESVTEGCVGEAKKATRLFYYVRDGIKYNPYLAMLPIDEYRASRTMERKEGYCTQKAVVLAALARACGIPATLGFADIVNHRVPEKLHDMMGTNLFVYHGYANLWLNDRWVKATPAFNAELCDKDGLVPVEFDGIHDAVFHPTNKDGQPHIEYVRYHGDFTDLPFEDIMRTFLVTYHPSKYSSQ